MWPTFEQAFERYRELEQKLSDPAVIADRTLYTKTAKEHFKRWHPFILTGLLAGLRWGESAALRKSDIDWKRGKLHVERTVSDSAPSSRVWRAPQTPQNLSSGPMLAPQLEQTVIIYLRNV